MIQNRLFHGSVALVGAGPGDPGLITIKGRDYLHQADVVVYDHLVSLALLDYTQSTAEIIYVGKKAGKHVKTQEQINQLLVSEAKQGKRVVRLKGGDPFIFGRGSEECEWLREHGISFEVVPGVSAVSAVPAYAGIPITARGVSPSFLAVTGHERACKGSPDVDWASIAQVNTTLVVFMGILSLRGICHELITHGRDPDTPIAVIRWGTVREKQVALTGTLSDMADRVEQESLRPPGLIVIGEVVRHRERLQWFEAHMGCGKAADAFPNG